MKIGGIGEDGQIGAFRFGCPIYRFNQPCLQPRRFCLNGVQSDLLFGDLGLALSCRAWMRLSRSTSVCCRLVKR